MHGMASRTMEYEGRTPIGLAKVGDKGKVTVIKTVRQNGECNRDGILRGAHPNGTNMDDNGDNS